MWNPAFYPGDKIALSSDLDEEWLPNPRGHISLCFPNKPGNGMENKEVQ